MLFGKRKTEKKEDNPADSGIHSGAENPFLKPGDIIRLRSRSGKYQVISTDHEGFIVHSYPSKHSNSSPIRCKWEEFKHWSRQ